MTVQRTTSIEPVTQTSIRATVTTATRNAIISGEFRPGEVYTGPGLAARFGVSATPVREAMLDLAKEGLVEVLRNKGFRITDVSHRDLAELAGIRVLIEPVVAAQVVHLIPAEDVPRLRAMAQCIVDQADAGNLADFIGADREFHLAILRYSGNQRLVDLVSQLRLQTRLLGLKPLMESGELVENAREHLTMVDLVEARDADGLQDALTRHIGQVMGKWRGHGALDAPRTSDGADLCGS